MKYLFLILITILIITGTSSAENESLPVKPPVNQEVSAKISPETNNSFCPAGMQHVSGEFCPEVQQRCLHWLDPDNKGVNGPTRCAEFAPSVCASNRRVHKDFCIDTYEFPNRVGEYPSVMISWTEAKQACEAEGKRLCGQSEWTFACEGEDMKPYPYGDGLHRDSNACNIDKPWLDPFTYDANHKAVGQKPLELVDQRARSGQYAACVSPFGVHDMTGNVDESVVNPAGKPFHSAEQGGHWATGARNRCRPMTVAHNESFKFYEIGARCCSNSK